jgi:acyl-coenzyme A thioesterase PaaI-like protein
MPLFFAANSLVPDVFVFTINFNTYLTRPVSSGVLVASGQVVSQSRRLIVAEAVVCTDGGDEVGRGSGSFIRSRLPLSPEIG